MNSSRTLGFAESGSQLARLTEIGNDYSFLYPSHTNTITVGLHSNEAHPASNEKELIGLMDAVHGLERLRQASTFRRKGYITTLLDTSRQL